MENIKKEIRIKNVKISNRVVMPPMVCFGWTDKDGIVTGKHIKHYRKRAKSKTGLIIVEAACISEDGKINDSQLGIWDDKHIRGLSEISDEIKKHNSTAMIQIHHRGFDNLNSFDDDTAASIRRSFKKAFERAKLAGFDGAELHGAHGFLLSQIMSPFKNVKFPDLEKRFAFVKDVISQLRYVADSDFLLGYRMGGNEPDIETGIEIAELLRKEGTDILHVSAGISSPDNPLIIPEDFPFSATVWMASEIKKHVSNIPVIAVGNIRTADQAEKILEAGYGDFTAVGRGMLADPFWAESIYSSERNIKPCFECNPCRWHEKAENCPERKH